MIACVSNTEHGPALELSRAAIPLCFSVSLFLCSVSDSVLSTVYPLSLSVTRIVNMPLQNPTLRKRRSNGERVRVTRACDRCKR
jgi:hypothetical protein